MWFLNYCAPFNFRDDESINAYRFVLYSEVFALFFVYFVFIILYKVSNGTHFLYPQMKEKREKPSESNPSKPSET